MKHVRAMMAIATVALPLAWMTGCNTIEGAGHDLENLGKGTAELAHNTDQALNHIGTPTAAATAATGPEPPPPPPAR